MTTVEQARELARFLTPLLRGAACGGSSSAEGAPPRPGPPRLGPPTDATGPDVDLALRLELQHVIGNTPGLLPPPDASQEDLDRARDRLFGLLANGDGHTRDVLWALLSGEDGKPHPNVLQLMAVSQPGDQRRWRGWSFLRSCWTAAARLVNSTGLRRQAAGLWMNALIGLVLLFAWWFAWPPSAGAVSAGELGLALFTIWCLSFLPSWLYVRFLGQRAGALWDEYVLNLHRLGWDRPGHLPRPAVNSQFFEEWFNDGGVLLAHRQNIYRQKFDAYYGKSVAESSNRQESHVKIETLFPIFLLTTTLAVCWTVVLWDSSFVRNPDSVMDILRFGFLGAYSFTLQMLVRRFFQSDLRPSAYANAMLRVITVLLLVAALYQLMPTNNLRTEAVVAFVVGLFPLVGMQALQRTAAAVLRVAVPSLTPPYPLNQVDGLSVWYEARLLEEGIEDMQSLATANFVDVMLHTRVPVGRLVDWVDQAHLYLHFDRIERGWLERKLGRRQKDRAVKAEETAKTKAQETAKTKAQETAQARVEEIARTRAEEMARTGTDGILRGSVTSASRAGTWTRTAFRQLGIRTATDLLKAFPPGEMDPDAKSSSGRPALTHSQAIKHAGLDVGQVRTMVRVLRNESSLAPIWNWQRRGVQRR
jgi:hypothetical protein